MDEQENEMLVGTYPGHFVGEVTLVHGKVNQALYTNGIDQWVNIGNHRDKCNLARCTKGFVMALWLRAPTVPTGRKHFYVNSGGHTSKSMGITLHQKNMKLIAYYRTESWEDWRITVEDFVDHVWYHVTQTWTATGLKLYFNGCLSGRQDVSTASVNHEEPWHTASLLVIPTPFLMAVRLSLPVKWHWMMYVSGMPTWTKKTFGKYTLVI